MLLGAQSTNETGAIIVYESPDALSWSFKGELNVDLGEFGYMWECPDYFELDGKEVLIFSPQGIDAEEDDYHNVFNVIYAIGELNLQTLTFTIHHMNELDKGFDFYAPQSFEANHERLLFGWAGVGESKFPTDDNKWAHCLTAPRKLSVKNNLLKQTPSDALEKLREDKQSLTISKGKTESIFENNSVEAYDVEIDLETPADLTIKLFESTKESFVISYDADTKRVVLDRSGMIHVPEPQYGTKRAGILSTPLQSIRILVDKSIVEVFVNEGELTFTTRLFPIDETKKVSIHSKSNATVTSYQMKRGISK